MAAKKGGDFLLKIEDSATPGSYSMLGGLRSNSLTINNEAIDATNKGSNQWREILDQAGIKSMSISGSGIFTSDATLTQARQIAISGLLTNFQIVDSDSGDTFQGKFKLTSLERGGEYNGEMTWSISLESSGEITVS